MDAACESRSRNAKLAVIGSGGMLYRDQPRFHREDATYRLIPKNATQEGSERLAFRLSHGRRRKPITIVFFRWRGCANWRPTE